jgi:hypothetical protein
MTSCYCVYEFPYFVTYIFRCFSLLFQWVCVCIFESALSVYSFFLFIDIVLLILIIINKGWLLSLSSSSHYSSRYSRIYLREISLSLLVDPVIVQPTLWWRWTSHLLNREPHIEGEGEGYLCQHVIYLLSLDVHSLYTCYMLTTYWIIVHCYPLDVTSCWTFLKCIKGEYIE